MTPPERCESRVSLRVLAGGISVALHLGLLFLLVALSGGRHDGIDVGDTPISELVLLRDRQADQRDGIESVPPEPVVPTVDAPELTADIGQPPSLAIAELPADRVEPDAPGETDAPAESIVPTPAENTTASDTLSAEVIDAPVSLVMPQAAKSEFERRLEHLAEELTKKPRAQVTWQQDGKQYQATLVTERAKNGLEFDRVVAEISAEDHGKQLTTRLRLKRLSFSHYSQMIDFWDPMVQLHADEVIGRFHVNSKFYLLYDGQNTPKFLGKVTTAAASFNTQAFGKRREAEIFRGGIETRAGRIDMPEAVQPFEWAPRDETTRIHELAKDTRIRFFADGSYMMRDLATGKDTYRNDPSNQPEYFIGSGLAKIYVQGVVAGKVLVYSPQRIVVEGNLTYAHDPRLVADSPDYLGLVSGGYVELASPDVTGPGDLDIHAAVFAGRRFIVRNFDHSRSATLRILGSLAAGSVSASEPRYAMKVEYDVRFEQQRPPGFPSTSRFAAEEWDGRWTEGTVQTASESF